MSSKMNVQNTTQHFGKKEHEMSEAIAHMKQLRDLGCGWVQAVTDTAHAFAVDQFELQREYQLVYP